MEYKCVVCNCTEPSQFKIKLKINGNQLCDDHGAYMIQNEHVTNEHVTNEHVNPVHTEQPNVVCTGNACIFITSRK